MIFNDNGSTDVDYAYDHNGNLTKDSNKKIAAITYNHLNLPTFIDFGTKGSISYEYNAAGAKIRKTVTETGKPTKTTDYIGGLVYENNALQCGQDAVVLVPLQRPFGNVRMTFAPDVPVRETFQMSATPTTFLR